MAKRKTARRRTYRARPSRSGGSRRKGITIAPLAGAVISALSAKRLWDSIPSDQADMGRKASIVFLGYDPHELGVNDQAHITSRLLTTYGPAIAGYAVHEVAGNPKGAFGTGVGLKLNRYLPRGINL